MFHLFLLVSIAAKPPAPLPWGPQHNGRSCPVPNWRLQNSTESCWSVGRQRAVLQVNCYNYDNCYDNPTVACVHLPWRRHDDPAATGMLIYDSNATGTAAPLAYKLVDPSPIVSKVCFDIVSET